jgi:chromosome partitioning protein
MSTKARMNVIVVASQKGGAGKSTLALHLGVAADVRTVLLDMDPQQTLAKWWRMREAEIPALAEATIGGISSKIELLRAEGYELCIVDTPPAVTASITAVIEIADLVLIPVRPSPADLWAVGATIDIARKAEKPFAFVLSQATRGATSVTQAMAALSHHGPVAGVVHSRVGFAGVLADGRTVTEHEPKGPAAAEVRDLWTFVRSGIDGSPKGRNRVSLHARKHEKAKGEAHG